MNKPAAIYARVSSDRQKENHTIASQTAALLDYAQSYGYHVPAEWIFQDEGYSGAVLVRPGLEALRDLAAEGQIAAALADRCRSGIRAHILLDGFGALLMPAEYREMMTSAGCWVWHFIPITRPMAFFMLITLAPAMGQR